MHLQENNVLCDKTLRLCLDMGEAMLTCGAEIRRVENTVERICLAYGAVHAEVFAIPSVIICSIRMKNGAYSVQIRRIKAAKNDLFKLEALNALSRRLCADTPELNEFEKELKKAKGASFYPFLAYLICSGIVSGSFSLVFGGGLPEALISSIIGVTVFLTDKKALLYINSVSKTALLAFIGGALCCLVGRIFTFVNIGAVIIGTVVLLVPGLSFGNALGNLLQGDLLSGVLGTVRAVLTAAMLSLGYILAFRLFSLTSSPVTRVEALVLRAITSLIGVAAFAVIFDIRPSHLAAVAVGGLITFLIYHGLLNSYPLFISSFSAASVMAAYSEFMARLQKAPAVIFSLPCSIPILPGITLYNAMNSLVFGSFTRAGEYFFDSVQVGGGIACGVALVAVVLGISKEIRQTAKKSCRILRKK